MRTHSSDTAERLRRYIDDQGLKAGDLLPTQQALCGELNISIRRLREGINLLQEQGLLESRKKGGTIVRDPDLAYLFKNIASHLEHTGYSEHDLICARAVIESAAVRIAAHRRKAKDLLKILSTIEDMEQSHAKGTPDETNDMEFHLALLKATQNPVLEVFGTLIVNVFFPKIRAGFMAPEQTRLLTLSEHRSIYQAVHDQDAEAASKAIYDHITAPLRGRKIREDGS